ncbi:PLDc N-terminal domain-containing protein [Corynebacterium alimapuense]|uniref:Uncharacterized protein n=1 Tax=Corynebacterium alimapuense TaxID=1576874 RepID=A0A3M8K9Y9_9CORY|nr:hypothetical protein C5L39_00895 [Corynebacterium alimapuense]
MAPVLLSAKNDVTISWAADIAWLIIPLIYLGLVLFVVLFENRSRGITSALLWGFVVLFFPIVGLLIWGIYVLFQRRKTMKSD